MVSLCNLETHMTLSDILPSIRHISVIENLKLTWTLVENNN
jgi:hypothetical protein